MKRWSLFAISISAHLGIAALLGQARRPVARAATTISISETKRPKREAPKPADPLPVEEKEPPRPPAARAKAARVEPKEPPQAAPPAEPSPAGAAVEALPDFGLALSGGTNATGLAVAAGQGAGPLRSAPVEKVVRKAQVLSTKNDVCNEAATKPKAKQVPTPAYTEAGRAAGIEGKVRVEVTVDERGRVISVRVLQGLGFGLDEAALDAAKRATFEPATQCGKPVAATFNIGMRFSI